MIVWRDWCQHNIIKYIIPNYNMKALRKSIAIFVIACTSILLNVSLGFGQNKPTHPTIGSLLTVIYTDSVDSGLAISKENPSDTLMFTPISRVRNASEKILYMYELMERKDNLELQVTKYQELDKLKSKQIEELITQNIKLNTQFNSCMSLNDDATAIIKEKDKVIKRKTFWAWSASIAGGILLVTTIILAK